MELNYEFWHQDINGNDLRNEYTYYPKDKNLREALMLIVGDHYGIEGKENRVAMLNLITDFGIEQDLEEDFKEDLKDYFYQDALDSFYE